MAYPLVVVVHDTSPSRRALPSWPSCAAKYPPAAAEIALGFRRRRLSNRDLFVDTLSALPVKHTPWVGRAGRERRAPVSRFCQVGRGIGVRASYAPRRRSEARTWSRNGGGAASGAAGFGFARTTAFFAALAAICASRLVAKSLAFASTGSASAPSRAMR